MPIPPDLEEKVYDEYMRIHRVKRIPVHVTDAIEYLNEYSVMYAEKVPAKYIEIERYCFGILCFDTLSHRNKFYRDYPSIAFILEEIEDTFPFTYRYVKFDLLTCCSSVTFESEGIIIFRYIRGVIKSYAGFFETPMSIWATQTALSVWDEICPSECSMIGGSVDAILCPDEHERGFDDGIFVVSYSEVDHKKNVVGRYVCDKGDRPRIMSGENVYTGEIGQDRWNKV